MEKPDSGQNHIVPPKIEIYHGTPQLKGPEQPAPGQKKRRWLVVTVMTMSAIIIGGGILLTTKAANLSSKIFVGQKTSFFQKLKDLVTISTNSTQVLLQGEQTGQVNVLLLGIGGAGHDGPYLSDTIIVAQIRPTSSQISLTSIPRDYWTQLPDGDYEKINAAFSEGYVKNHDWNQAGLYARQVVQQLTGLNIPYFGVVDFQGFTQAVNQIGGLDVTVDRTFTDYSYPDNGSGYLPPVTFTAGPQHMDGTRALEFARSRHAAGAEGSDFARSQRQQKILEAFKAKIFGSNIFSDVNNINSVLNVFANHFHTNMSPAEVYHVLSLIQTQNMTMTSNSLDPTTNIICSEIMANSGAYILTPCIGKTVVDIRNFFQDTFLYQNLKDENTAVYIANSTGNQLTYETAKRVFVDAGLTVYDAGAFPQNLPQTLVYQIHPKPATVLLAQQQLNATVTEQLPNGITVPTDKADIVIILGQNAPSQPEPTPYTPPPAYKPATTQASTTLTTQVGTSAPATTSPEIMIPISSQTASSSN